MYLGSPDELLCRNCYEILNAYCAYMLTGNGIIWFGFLVGRDSKTHKLHYWVILDHHSNLWFLQNDNISQNYLVLLVFRICVQYGSCQHFQLFHYHNMVYYHPARFVHR